MLKMATDAPKQEFSEEIKHSNALAPPDPEKSHTVTEKDGEVTMKTKLAVLSLILMYESYLFTLLMYARAHPFV